MSQFLKRIRDVVNHWYSDIPDIKTAVDSINNGSIRETKDLTIADGNKISNGAIDCEKKQLIAVKFPAAFDGAELQFLGSADNNTFEPIYAPSGNRYFVSVQTEAWMYLDEPMATLPFRYVKVKSSVSETAQRSLTAIIRHVS